MEPRYFLDGEYVPLSKFPPLVAAMRTSAPATFAWYHPEEGTEAPVDSSGFFLDEVN